MIVLKREAELHSHSSMASLKSESKSLVASRLSPECRMSYCAALRGDSGFTTLTTDVQALKAQIATLQSANATLQRALDLANVQLNEAHKQIQFLQECLTRPLPWPGGSLCPKPQK
jgi:hypothetical protein